MPTIINYIIATILFATSVGITLRTLRIAHALRKQRQLVDDADGSLCSLGTVGCSILCSRISHIDQISALLSTEHDRIEVIVILDSNLYAEQFELLIRHFKLLRVNTPEHTELAHLHIRTLYRSGQRCFRRLILVDQGYISPYDDMNAATAIAAYDYLIPLAAPHSLRQDALDNIFITLAENPDFEVGVLSSRADGGIVLQRDIVIEAGGFSRNMRLSLSRNKSIEVNFPLLTSTAPVPQTKLFYAAALLIALLCYLISGLKIALIAMLASIIMATAIRYTAKKIDDGNSRHSILCHILPIRRFFCRRKFLVS